MENEIKTKKDMLTSTEPKEGITEYPQNDSELKTIPLRLLSDLDDVTITNPQNNHILKYSSTSGKWENSAP